MEKSAVEELQAVIDKLTSPEGCPWDKEQTHKKFYNNYYKWD